jgi:hypothetical protein
MTDTTEPHRRTAPFRCPVCLCESDINTRCPTCDVMLDDLREAQRWQLDARHQTRSSNASQYALLYKAILLAAFAVPALNPAVGMWPLWAIPAVIVAIWAQGYFAPDQVALRKARRAHTIEAATKRASAVNDGERVAFAGMPAVRAWAIAEEGIRALACSKWRRVSESASDLTLHSLARPIQKRLVLTVSGGEFELTPDEGITVRVRLDHFVLLRGEKTRTTEGIAEIIAEGTPVRVSGVARWVDDPDSSGMRSTGRMILLEGTQENPIVIEPVALDQWIDAQPTTSTTSTTTKLRAENARASEVVAQRTGVRVSSDTERAESESAEPVLRSESHFEETRTGVQKR